MNTGYNSKDVPVSHITTALIHSIKVGGILSNTPSLNNNLILYPTLDLLDSLALPHMIFGLCSSLKAVNTIFENCYPIVFPLISVHHTFHPCEALCLLVRAQIRQTLVAISLNRGSTGALSPTQS